MTCQCFFDTALKQQVISKLMYDSLLQSTKADILKNVSTIFVYANKVNESDFQCMDKNLMFCYEGWLRSLLHYSQTDPRVSTLSHLQLHWVWSRDRWPVGEREPGSQAQRSRPSDTPMHSVSTSRPSVYCTCAHKPAAPYATSDISLDEPVSADVTLDCMRATCRKHTHISHRQSHVHNLLREATDLIQ